MALKDDVLVALSESLGRDNRRGNSLSNDLIIRFPADGSGEWEPVIPHGNGRIMRGWAANVREPMTHYPWAVAIDDREARFIATGFGSEGVYSLRMKMSDDPTGYNKNRFDDGFFVHEIGTVGSFPTKVRPPLSEMYGFRGFNQYGDAVLNFDDMALLSENIKPKDPDGTSDKRAFKNNVDIAEFIRDGMDGRIRRPEITGHDLASYIYHIRYYSLEGETKEIDVAKIDQELHNAGLHDLDDSRSPEIRNVKINPLDGDSVRITWQTDEAAIGLVEYGPTPQYGLYSPIESDFGRNHTIDLHDLIGNGISKGSYHFAVYARDLSGNTSVSRDATFSIAGGNTDPVAKFVASPLSGAPPLVVDFNASLSTDDGDIVSYSWNFDDGTTAKGKTASHSFKDVGNYTVTLTVKDNSGKTGKVTKIISVSEDGGTPDPIAPKASFTAAPTSGQAPLNVSFNASKSSDVDGKIEVYSWDFGDGTNGSGIKVNHTYQKAGNYTVTLLVTDDTNLSDTTATVIKVINDDTPAPTLIPPTASFTLNTTEGKAPLTVNCNASTSTDSDGNIVSYTWNFGDKAKGKGVKVNHVYKKAGNYTITLTVTDNRWYE